MSYTISSHNASAMQQFHPPAGFFGFAGGLTDDATCFCRGTRILTPLGDVEVEDLNIGDWVVTASGTPQKIRWIGRRSYAARMLAGKKSLLPIRFRAGSIGEGLPERDLRVSPAHAIFLDGLLIPAQRLVNGLSITQEDCADDVDYFHIELDRHDVLLAEGTPAESFIENHHGRMLFYNGAEYAALYPNDRPDSAIPCAPRQENGPLVDAVWQRLAQRSSRFVRPGPGLVTGSFQLVNGLHVRGWVRHSAHLDLPMRLDIVVNGTVVQHCLADIDGRTAGWADLPAGACGFLLKLPAGLTRQDIATLAITCSADGTAIRREEMRQAA